MASVGEVRSALAHAVMKAGEAYAVLEQAKEQCGAAIESYAEAYRTCAEVAEGALNEGPDFAMRKYIEAESKARAMMQNIEDAQDAGQAGTESAELYMGML